MGLIQIHLGKIDDFRKATKILDQGNKDHHIFNTEDDKSLRLVVKGIPKFMGNAEIQEQLEEPGFEIFRIVKMYR